MGQKIFLIDSNIFLGTALDRKKFEDSFEFLKQVAAGKFQIAVTSFTVHTLEVVLWNSQKQEILRQFLDDFKDWENCEVYSTSISEEKEIVDLAQRIKLDFDDALQYYAAKKLNAAIVSFDRHFDNTDLTRLEPKDLLSAVPDN